MGMASAGAEGERKQRFGAGTCVDVTATKPKVSLISVPFSKKNNRVVKIFQSCVIQRTGPVAEENVNAYLRQQLVHTQEFFLE